jgi:hypothetical protein
MLAGRFVGNRTGRVAARWDAVTHPLSILAVLGLVVSSWVGRVRGTLRWKGRTV